MDINVRKQKTKQRHRAVGICLYNIKIIKCNQDGCFLAEVNGCKWLFRP